METTAVERIQPEGWARVRRVRLRALADSPDAFGTTLAEDEAKPIEIWRTRLENPVSATFLATQDGQDVGIAVGFPDAERPGVAGIFSMWIAADARRQGLGAALVDAVITWARDEGHADLVLEVADTNEPAVRLYASMGFLPTGVTGSLPAPRQHMLEHERMLSLRP